VDAFSYLSVLLSIIVGLAITQILQGYRGLLLARGRVRFYAPTLIWSAMLLVISAQVWWASFGLTNKRDWTFLQFSTVLLQVVLLYMMAGLVLPDVPAEAPVDLRDHYYRERRPFYGTFLLMLAVSISKDWVLGGRLPAPENLAFATTRSPRRWGRWPWQSISRCCSRGSPDVQVFGKGLLR
jgi:hypothetical protein